MRRYFPYFSAPYRRWGRRLRLLFLLFLIAAFFYLWQMPEMDKLTGRNLQTNGALNEKKEEIERIGEQIVYDVYLGKVRLGEAKYHHLKKTRLNGQLVHLISFQTKAMRFRDQEMIYCDAESFLPLIVERKVSQFLKPETIKEEYDQKAYKLTITKKRFTTEVHVIEKEEPIHNSILLPYLVRNKPELEIGWSFDVNLPQRKYKIILTAIEPVQVSAGEFMAYYFESEPRQIKIWVSKDKARIPLKLEGTGGFGYKLLMRQYSVPKNSVE